VRVFIRAERLFDFQGFWVIAPDASLPLPQLLSTGGPYVGLFCYIRSNSSVLVHVMVPQLS
jgi:hypothetical protein